MAGSAPTTIVFDVLGTVLDEDAGMLAAAVELAGPDAADGLRTSWKKGLSGEVGAINRGEAPYRLQDDLNVPVLDRALASFGLAVAPDAVRRAARFGHHLRPFSDSPGAFERLYRAFHLVTLTTAGLAQAADMSFSSGIRWHLMLSCELVQAYKPDPRTYCFVLEKLGLDPADHLLADLTGPVR